MPFVSLLLASLLVGPTGSRPYVAEPAPALRCVSSCSRALPSCWFDLAAQCDGPTCEDLPERRCVPRVVVLGSWAPVLDDYGHPAAYSVPDGIKEPDPAPANSTFSAPEQ